MGFLSNMFGSGGDDRGTQGIYNAQRQLSASRAITDPYYQQQVESGSAANQRLSDFLGLNGQGAQRTAHSNYMTSPGFDAQLQRGTDAIDQSAIARGMSQSGAALKELQGYGQGLYAQDYGSHLSRLSGLQGQGSAGAAGLTQGASQMGNLFMNLGQYQDAANAASANNIMGGIGTLVGSFANPAGQAKGGGFGSLGRLFGG